LLALIANEQNTANCSRDQQPTLISALDRFEFRLAGLDSVAAVLKNLA
jgi:hypothetical protein